MSQIEYAYGIKIHFIFVYQSTKKKTKKEE